MASLKPPSFENSALEQVKNFFRLEAAGGILLVFFAILAIVAANSPLRELYIYIFNGFHFPNIPGFEKTLLHWINDALMAIFFLLAGLEIKREMVGGELAGRAKATLPILAAIGGMIVPALIYAAINRDSPATIHGWAIPCATDIAFALGVLSLLGNRVPLSLKVLLTAIAIIDDLGAILIIALFYSGNLETGALLLALIPLGGLFLLNKGNVIRCAPYIFLGLLLWLAILKSGVHATMAGVITAFFIPVSVPESNPRPAPAKALETALHPWVVFLILPLFAFANAGVPFDGMGLHSLADPVTLGIILGLFIGKQIGVFGAIYLAVKLGLCPKPESAGWAQIYGMAILCGIGFTMSLFIGSLAFADPALQAELRLGVLVGSVFSAGAGYILLKSTSGAKS